SWIELDHLVVVAIPGRDLLAGTEERHVDAAVDGHHRHGPLIVDEGAGDLHWVRPGFAAVVRHASEDWRANVTAAGTQVEPSPGNDGVAMAPGNNVILVI